MLLPVLKITDEVFVYLWRHNGKNITGMVCRTKSRSERHYRDINYRLLMKLATQISHLNRFLLETFSAE